MTGTTETKMTTKTKSKPKRASRADRISVQALRKTELPEAKRIFHLAFGTFLGLPDPMQFFPDRDFVRTRYHTDPSGAFGASIGGKLIGSNFATDWGSVGFFGPLTIRPDFWDRGVAQRLLERTMKRFAQWGTEHIGLFTFAHSARHIGLYQKFLGSASGAALFSNPKEKTHLAPRPPARWQPALPGQTTAVLSECSRADCPQHCCPRLRASRSRLR